MSVVREEFGPTLPELLGERLHVPARTIWRVLAAVGVVVVLVLAWLAFVRGTPGQAGVVVRGPVTFNLIYTDALHKRRAARRRERCACRRAPGRRSPSPCARCAWRPTRAT